MSLRVVPRLHRLAGSALVVACALGAGPALHADEGGHDHDRARQALEQGQVLPLRTVLDRVEREYQGQALKVEFEQDDGRFIYEIRLLQRDGRLVKLKVDAVDGRVLKIKRKGP
ncbi:MAG TPA: PepSY domain-containing protein [Acidovorax sp.]|nr:PepSY domain-containing protein [Acidovorax sp.]